MSFDDLFWKREFSSYIKKESNVYDRAISPNWDGLDALLESERIRTEMLNRQEYMKDTRVNLNTTSRTTSNTSVLTFT